MAAPKLIVNGLDLSGYLDVQHESGMDPAAPGFLVPQFSGNPALRDGRRHVVDTADNREGVFPLILDAASRAELHKLISDIEAVLVRNASVEFASDSSGTSSFLTLEGGHLDVKYEYFLTGVALTTRAVLHLSTRPFAHTGSTRLIASAPQGSAAVVAFPATGILGDAYAQANLEVRVGSAVASAGRVVMFGVHAHPSHRAYRPATSGRAQTGATVRGASGAIGSQYTAIPVSPTGASGVAYQEFLDPPDAHVGRHRVIAFGRSGLNVPMPIYAMDRFGAILGATAIVTQTDVNKWQMVDLGEVHVPARATGQESVPTQYVNLVTGGASGAAINASPAFHLNGLLFLPVDYSAGILRTAGAGQPFIRDSFKSNIDPSSESLDYHTADTGQAWSKASGVLYAYAQEVMINKAYRAEIGGFVPIASQGFYDVASGGLYDDAQLSVGLRLGPSGLTPVTASGVTWDVWITRTPSLASAGVWARFEAGPSQRLTLFAGNGVTATAIASAGIASTRASGLYQNQVNYLTIRKIGGRTDVWLATGPLNASPVLSAAHPMMGQPGNPALRLFPGGTPVDAARFRGPFTLTPAGGSAPDISPREYFRFESFPEGRVVQGNASVFTDDRLANYRGSFPKMPPVGSGNTSPGPARVVVFQSEIDNVIGNDGPEFALSVLENWKFLR